GLADLGPQAGPLDTPLDRLGRVKAVIERVDGGERIAPLLLTCGAHQGAPDAGQQRRWYGQDVGPLLQPLAGRDADGVQHPREGLEGVRLLRDGLEREALGPARAKLQSSGDHPRASWRLWEQLFQRDQLQTRVEAAG